MIPRTVNVFELLVLLICLLTVVCTSLSDAVDTVGLSGAVLDERLNIDDNSEVSLEILNTNEQWLETTQIEMKKGFVDEKEERSSYELTASRKEASLSSTYIDTDTDSGVAQIGVGSTDIDSQESSKVRMSIG